jgi:hypothetical protein
MVVQVVPPQLFLETCDRRIAADHEEFHTSHFRKILHVVSREGAAERRVMTHSFFVTQGPNP